MYFVPELPWSKPSLCWPIFRTKLETFDFLSSLSQFIWKFQTPSPLRVDIGGREQKSALSLTISLGAQIRMKINELLGCLVKSPGVNLEVLDSAFWFNFYVIPLKERCFLLSQQRKLEEKLIHDLCFQVSTTNRVLFHDIVHILASQMPTMSKEKTPKHSFLYLLTDS